MDAAAGGVAEAAADAAAEMVVLSFGVLESSYDPGGNGSGGGGTTPTGNTTYFPIPGNKWSSGILQTIALGGVLGALLFLTFVCIRRHTTHHRGTLRLRRRKASANRVDIGSSSAPSSVRGSVSGDGSSELAWSGQSPLAASTTTTTTAATTTTATTTTTAAGETSSLLLGSSGEHATAGTEAAAAAAELAAMPLRRGLPGLWLPSLLLSDSQRQQQALDDELYVRDRSYFGWILPVLRCPDREVIRRSGLDAYVYLYFEKILIWYFGIMMVLCLASLLPINLTCKEEVNGFTTTTAETFPRRSLWLWAPLVGTFAFTLMTFFLIWEYVRQYQALRVKALSFDRIGQHSSPETKQAALRFFTLMISGLPHEVTNESLLWRYFEQLYQGQVHFVHIALDPGEISSLRRRYLRACRRLERYEYLLAKAVAADALVAGGQLQKQKQQQQRRRQKKSQADANDSDTTRLLDSSSSTPLPEDAEEAQEEQAAVAADELVIDGVPARLRPRINVVRNFEIPFTRWVVLKRLGVDAVQFYEERIESLGNRIAEAARDGDRPGTGVAFVTFRTVGAARQCQADFSAFERLRWLNGPLEARVLRPAEWTVCKAPHPRDIIFKNLGMPWYLFYPRVLAINVLIVGLLFFFTTPLSIIGGVNSNVHRIPFLEGIVSQSLALLQDNLFGNLIYSYLPTLLLALITVILPPILGEIAKLEGHSTVSDRERSTTRSVFLYLFMSTFLLPSLFLTSLDSLIEFAVQNRDTAGVWYRLSHVYPNAAFFINYIIQTSFISLCFYLLRIPALIRHLWLRFNAVTPNEMRRANTQEHFEYGYCYAWTLNIFTIALFYGTVVPLILPAALLYVTLRRFVDKYNLLCVHPHEYETDSNIVKTVIGFIILSHSIYLLGMFAFFFVKEAEIQAFLVAGLLILSIGTTLYIFLCRPRTFSTARRHRMALDANIKAEGLVSENPYANPAFRDAMELVRRYSEATKTAAADGHAADQHAAKQAATSELLDQEEDAMQLDDDGRRAAAAGVTGAVHFS